MSRPCRPTTAVVAIAAAAVLAATIPASTAAQTAVQSPVPKDPCCFNNFRYAGSCQVMPRQGQLCEDILGYLNSIDSAGETSCRSTRLRGGWTLVDCDTGEPAAPIGFTDKSLIDPTEEPTVLDVESGPSQAGLPSPTEHTPADLRELRLEVATRRGPG
ncbi:MAG TPA: hypothetical protein VLT32_19055 [Candidatus Sulfomarinibacteraceae bacterium]|nr:hypothetical protein [Candidatus Sulfomarinibacteraceae bacterium]